MSSAETYCTDMLKWTSTVKGDADNEIHRMLMTSWPDAEVTRAWYEDKKCAWV